MTQLRPPELPHRRASSTVSRSCAPPSARVLLRRGRGDLGRWLWDRRRHVGRHLSVNEARAVRPTARELKVGVERRSGATRQDSPVAVVTPGTFNTSNTSGVNPMRAVVDCANSRQYGHALKVALNTQKCAMSSGSTSSTCSRGTV